MLGIWREGESEMVAVSGGRSTSSLHVLTKARIDIIVFRFPNKKSLLAQYFLILQVTAVSQSRFGTERDVSPCSGPRGRLVWCPQWVPRRCAHCGRRFPGVPLCHLWLDRSTGPLSTSAETVPVRARAHLASALHRQRGGLGVRLLRREGALGPGD